MTKRVIIGYVVSDYSKDNWTVTGIFNRHTPVEMVKSWATDSSHITIFFSDTFQIITLGMKLPKVYCPKTV